MIAGELRGGVAANGPTMPPRNLSEEFSVGTRDGVDALVAEGASQTRAQPPLPLEAEGGGGGGEDETRANDGAPPAAEVPAAAMKEANRGADGEDGEDGVGGGGGGGGRSITFLLVDEGSRAPPRMRKITGATDLDQLQAELRDALGLAAHAPLVYLAPEFDEWVVMDELASLPDKCRVRAVADKAEADHAVLDAGGNGAADSTEVADASYS